MKENRKECKHRPKYSPVLNYAGKNKVYICKNCGKRIKVNSAAELLLVVLIIILSLSIVYITDLSRLQNTAPFVFFIVSLFILFLIVSVPGSFIYFNFLPFHVVDDEAVQKQRTETDKNLVSTQENEAKKEPVPKQKNGTKDQ